MKKICFFALLTVCALTLTWSFAAEEISADLNENIVRLHIIANSDTTDDQALKLSVRDRLLDEAGSHPDLLTDEEILHICQDEIATRGYGYPVTVQRGRFSFPRKQYENLTLPAGDYNAVRIIIGEGAGANWWCVMYPPLCFTGQVDGLEEDALAELKNSLRPETFSAICETDHITVKPSFKLLELWQSFKSRH